MENIPSISIPRIEKIETISIPLPTADVPYYVPMVIPPSDLKEPDGVQAEQTDEVDTGIRNVNIPIIDFDVPLPENEILITCLLYTSPSPRDAHESRMPSSA